MIVGYARTSTADQLAGLEAQERELKAAACERVWKEHVSSVAARPELEAALDFIREGDTFVVTKPDRLARSVADLLELIERIKAKGVVLRVLSVGLDTSTATGELILNVLGSVAQFERQIMLERQREGIAKAKSAGKYKGRKPTARMKGSEIARLLAEGVGPSEIAGRLCIGRTSVYRVRKEGERAKAAAARPPRPIEATSAPGA